MRDTSVTSGSRWFPFKNISGEEISPYSVIEITDGERTSEAEGQRVFVKGDKPSGLSGIFALTGPQTTAIDGYGAATIDGPAWMAYDDADGTPANGDGYGAESAEWVGKPDGDDFLVIGPAIDDEDPKRVLVLVNQATSSSASSDAASRGCCAPCIDRRWMTVANRNYAAEYSVSGIAAKYGGDSNGKIYLSHIGKSSGLPGITDGDDYWESPTFNFSCCNCSDGMSFSFTDPVYGSASLSLIGNSSCTATGSGTFDNAGDTVTWSATFNIAAGTLTLTYTSAAIGTCTATYHLNPSTQSITGSGTLTFDLSTGGGTCTFGSTLSVSASGGNCSNAGGGMPSDEYQWRMVIGNSDSCEAGGGTYNVWLYLVSATSATNCTYLAAARCSNGVGTATDTVPWVQYWNTATEFRARCGSTLNLKFPQLQRDELDDLPCEVCVAPVGRSQLVATTCQQIVFDIWGRTIGYPDPVFAEIATQTIGASFSTMGPLPLPGPFDAGNLGLATGVQFFPTITCYPSPPLASLSIDVGYTYTNGGLAIPLFCQTILTTDTCHGNFSGLPGPIFGGLSGVQMTAPPSIIGAGVGDANNWDFQVKTCVYCCDTLDGTGNWTLIGYIIWRITEE